MVVALVAGGSNDDAVGDAALSASAPAPTPASSRATAVAAATTQTSPSTPEAVVDQAALREAIAEVEGLEGLAPSRLACLSSRLADDEGVLEALDLGVTFEVLEPDLRERVLLMAVGCAPTAVAAAVVDGIEAEFGDEARVCVVDRMAGDDGFLVALVQVALATDEAESEITIPPAVAEPGTTVIPPAVTDRLEALMAACDVPLSALPE